MRARSKTTWECFFVKGKTIDRLKDWLFVHNVDFTIKSYKTDKQERIIEVSLQDEHYIMDANEDSVILWCAESMDLDVISSEAFYKLFEEI